MGSIRTDCGEPLQQDDHILLKKRPLELVFPLILGATFLVVNVWLVFFSTGPLIPRIVLIVLTVLFLLLFVWSHSMKTLINSEGIFHKSLFQSYEYHWEEISSWDIEVAEGGDRSVFFHTGPHNKRHFVQILDERKIVNTIALFRYHLGDPGLE